MYLIIIKILIISCSDGYYDVLQPECL